MKSTYANIALSAFVVLGTMPTLAAAQSASRLNVAVLAGPSPLDLSGTGTGIVGMLAASWHPFRGLIVEPAIGVLSYRTQYGSRETYALPELSVQGEVRLGRTRPFLGIGGGAALTSTAGGGTTGTVHGVLGVRYDVGPAWGLRTELRVRSIRPWSGTTADILLGFIRRLR